MLFYFFYQQTNSRPLIAFLSIEKLKKYIILFYLPRQSFSI